jgi:large subunit ribosomal protein L6
MLSKMLLPINLPANVQALVRENMLYIKGPLGIQCTKIINDEVDKKILKKMIKGVTEGFYKKLKLVGVGYKAMVNDTLGVHLGFNQPLIFPLDISISSKSNGTIIEGKNKSLDKLTQYMSKIVLVRPASKDIYKGKGVVVL